MSDERNLNQIIRKDARNCFVESLSDAFDKGRAHFAFATYDLSKPAGGLFCIALGWCLKKKKLYEK